MAELELEAQLRIGSDLGKDFGRLFRSGNDNNFEIRCGLYRFRVHLAIVQARAPILRQLISDCNVGKLQYRSVEGVPLGLTINQGTFLELDDYDPAVIETILRYVYTEECDITPARFDYVIATQQMEGDQNTAELYQRVQNPSPLLLFTKVYLAAIDWKLDRLQCLAVYAFRCRVEEDLDWNTYSFCAAIKILWCECDGVFVLGMKTAMLEIAIEKLSVLAQHEGFKSFCLECPAFGQRVLQAAKARMERENEYNTQSDSEEMLWDASEAACEQPRSKKRRLE